MLLSYRKYGTSVHLIGERSKLTILHLVFFSSFSCGLATPIRKINIFSVGISGFWSLTEYRSHVYRLPNQNPQKCALAFSVRVSRGINATRTLFAHLSGAESFFECVRQCTHLHCRAGARCKTTFHDRVVNSLCYVTLLRLARLGEAAFPRPTFYAAARARVCWM